MSMGLHGCVGWAVEDLPTQRGCRSVWEQPWVSVSSWEMQLIPEKVLYPSSLKQFPDETGLHWKDRCYWHGFMALNYSMLSCTLTCSWSYWQNHMAKPVFLHCVCWNCLWNALVFPSVAQKWVLIPGIHRGMSSLMEQAWESGGFIWGSCFTLDFCWISLWKLLEIHYWLAGFVICSPWGGIWWCRDHGGGSSALWAPKPGSGPWK